MVDNAEWQIRKGRGGVLQAQRARNRKNGFSDALKKKFLQEFAASGNATASAEAIGKSVSIVYTHRHKDPAFREAWAAAQDMSYAALEAELVRRARELLEAACPQEVPAVQGMDAKLAFAMLQNFQRRSGREPGDLAPRRSDLSEATRRLEATMTRLKLLPPPLLAAPSPASDSPIECDDRGEPE